MKQNYGSRSGGASSGGQPSGTGNRPTDHNDEIAQALMGKNRIELWSGGSRRTIRSELLDEEAQERARLLKEVPSTQLRRFYGPTVAFKQRIQIDREITEGEVRAQVAYLKASSAYAGSRQKSKALVEFFVAAANSVKNREEYLAFAQHFEAVMAFHKVFEKKGTEQ